MDLRQLRHLVYTVRTPETPAVDHGNLISGEKLFTGHGISIQIRGCKCKLLSVHAFHRIYGLVVLRLMQRFEHSLLQLLKFSGIFLTDGGEKLLTVLCRNGIKDITVRRTDFFSPVKIDRERLSQAVVIFCLYSFKISIRRQQHADNSLHVIECLPFFLRRIIGIENLQRILRRHSLVKKQYCIHMMIVVNRSKRLRNEKSFPGLYFLCIGKIDSCHLKIFGVL